MKLYRQQPWGIETLTSYRNARQCAAAPGLTVANLLGRSLTVSERRMLRKRGVVLANAVPSNAVQLRSPPSQ